MSLLTTWTKKNRVITSDLTTTYTRSLEGSGYATHWLYTRTRKKDYAYVGMTHETALLCSKAMISLYNRWYLDQEFWNGGGELPNGNFCWRYVLGPNDSNRSSSPVHVSNTYINYHNEKNVADVCVEHEEGDAWKVSVSICEVLSYKYRNPTDHVNYRTSIWTQFETDPTGAAYQFTGLIADQYCQSENYDTADNGYGSPV